jgi:hypothetical protein
MKIESDVQLFDLSFVNKLYFTRNMIILRLIQSIVVARKRKMISNIENISSSLTRLQ